ncbi:nucleoside triphosphate pyrophosphohydrolase [Halomicrobium salinisoli]|uniref:nucleoside triphosphate pyrophosphohydrolase n=1 Tax=Halomicrobium salinisoli TaxID=2878391 RepID=UPI001CF01681|nr:nucleoside triphosphate pyrophosphohydrolase [Halomicrobium salinisoli]
MPREYDKLVRDGIPEIIRESDEEPVTHTVDGEAYRERLREKLDEEVAEYHESGDPEELADVLEVVAALAGTHDLSEDELEAMREAKADERGRFEDGVVLEAVRE